MTATAVAAALGVTTKVKTHKKERKNYYWGAASAPPAALGSGSPPSNPPAAAQPLPLPETEGREAE